MSARGIVEGVDAVATLSPTEGNDVRGRVTFAEIEDGVLVVAEVSGLSAGMHGFHIHENGDCSAPDASSAGGHYDPTGAPHGAPNDPASERHVGDLGNLEAGADGVARYERVDSVISLSGPNTIVGKAVIVHAGQDDYTTQPTGAAGGRLACGIIEATEG
jgi:Cu-Zn family superoxide dismutase